MSGAIAFYGLLIFVVLITFTGVDFNKKIMMDEDVHSATRTTQLSTLQESINIGDLIVNNKLSMDSQRAIDLWLENFELNKDMRLTYDIEFIDTHEEPPAIAVRVRGYSSYLMLETECVVDYFNLIIVDDPIERN
ncbi:MAG: DUF5411 family protein [Erysipelotrichaceae bacterium]